MTGLPDGTKSFKADLAV